MGPGLLQVNVVRALLGLSFYVLPLSGRGGPRRSSVALAGKGAATAAAAPLSAQANRAGEEARQTSAAPGSNPWVDDSGSRGEQPQGGLTSEQLSGCLDGLRAGRAAAWYASLFTAPASWLRLYSEVRVRRLPRGW